MTAKFKVDKPFNINKHGPGAAVAVKSSQKEVKELRKLGYTYPAAGAPSNSGEASTLHRLLRGKLVRIGNVGRVVAKAGKCPILLICMKIKDFRRKLISSLLLYLT